MIPSEQPLTLSKWLDIMQGSSVATPSSVSVTKNGKKITLIQKNNENRKVSLSKLFNAMKAQLQEEQAELSPEKLKTLKDRSTLLLKSKWQEQSIFGKIVKIGSFIKALWALNSLKRSISQLEKEKLLGRGVN